MGGPSYLKANAGGYCAIALDAQGQPHISHSSDFAVDYSHLVGGTWVNAIVDDNASIGGGFTSIELDGNGTPLISYYDFEHHQLKFAKQM